MSQHSTLIHIIERMTVTLTSLAQRLRARSRQREADALGRRYPPQPYTGWDGHQFLWDNHLGLPVCAGCGAQAQEAHFSHVSPTVEPFSLACPSRLPDAVWDEMRRADMDAWREKQNT